MKYLFRAKCNAFPNIKCAASLAGTSQLRIVHGHGTGALRRAIGDLLKDHPHVARFTAAPQDQGGSGATVVELRQ